MGILYIILFVFGSVLFVGTFIWVMEWRQLRRQYSYSGPMEDLMIKCRSARIGFIGFYGGSVLPTSEGLIIRAPLILRLLLLPVLLPWSIVSDCSRSESDWFFLLSGAVGVGIDLDSSHFVLRLKSGKKIGLYGNGVSHVEKVFLRYLIEQEEALITAGTAA